MQLKYLPKIKSPKDLKELDRNSLNRLCDELRYYTVNTITEIGGHLAPTLGVIELTRNSIIEWHIFCTVY